MTDVSSIISFAVAVKHRASIRLCDSGAPETLRGLKNFHFFSLSANLNRPWFRSRPTCPERWKRRLKTLKRWWSYWLNWFESCTSEALRTSARHRRQSARLPSDRSWRGRRSRSRRTDQRRCTCCCMYSAALSTGSRSWSTDSALQ